MKSFPRAGLFFLLCILAGRLSVSAQIPLVSKIAIEHIGPHAVSDSLIRANIRSQEGKEFSPHMVDEDVKNLYATGYFINIRVAEEPVAGGSLKLIYIVQGKPLLTEIKFSGNKKYSDRKLKKKVKSKKNEPLDRRKLFEDAQEIQKMYEKAGYQKTTVKAVDSANENTGKGSVTFEVHEQPKIKIKDIVFENAKAFPQKKLRKQIKTKRRWFFSFLTGSGVVKEDEFEDDKDRLIEFYQNEGYIDFQIVGEPRREAISAKKMIIHFDVSEGTQYKVGAIEFKGNTLFSTNDFFNGVVVDKMLMKLRMTVGKTFTPGGLKKDVETLQDIYGAKGYIDTHVVAIKRPNPTTGTMDVVYQVEEGKQIRIEKIEIKGNIKTKDRVIRRELAVSPGEIYDTVRVKLSKQRLEGLDYFEKVDALPEESDAGPDRRNLVVGVDEKHTGQMLFGAGFSSVDSLVAFVEVSQGNFDLFKPPTFTGAGQKARLKAQVGTQRQDYEATFIEPWFLGRKLSFQADLFYRNLGFLSLNNIYDETHAGGRLSLTRALGSDFLRGTIFYGLENVDLKINPGFTTNNPPATNQTLTSAEIYNERGSRLVSKIGASLAYDTRNHALLPNKGQRTELLAEVAGPFGGDTDFYKLELRSAWYFKGFAEGHVIEIAGRGGVAQNFGNTPRVPIFDRWFLGGLYSLRGYRFRDVGPKDSLGTEPIGGDTYVFGTAEYSIPIIERLRIAAFYDIGNVYEQAFSFNPGNRAIYSDNWGLGLRIDIPHLGPLRFDYGIPISHDPGHGYAGKFQFGVGYKREF